MEPIGVTAEWKFTTTATGSAYATVTGTRNRQRWCAGRWTVVPPSFSHSIPIWEAHPHWTESKSPVLGMRPPSHSAQFKNSRKHAQTLPFCVQVCLCWFAPQMPTFLFSLWHISIYPDLFYPFDRQQAIALGERDPSVLRASGSLSRRTMGNGLRWQVGHAGSSSGMSRVELWNCHRSQVQGLLWQGSRSGLVGWSWVHRWWEIPHRLSAKRFRGARLWPQRRRRPHMLRYNIFLTC